MMCFLRNRWFDWSIASKVNNDRTTKGQLVQLYLKSRITTTLSCTRTKTIPTTSASSSAVTNKRFFSTFYSFVNTSKASKPKRNISKNFNPYPFTYHQELTIQVENLNNMGLGVCRVPISTDIEQETNAESSSSMPFSSSSLWVILVPNVIPGELIRIRIHENKKRHSNAELLQVLEPQTQYRVQTPKCSLAGICGGCQYQHMTIDSQRYWKTKQVQEALNRITKHSLHQVQPTLGNDQIWNYRSKITPHYELSEKQQHSSSNAEDMGPIMGFQQQSSYQLIDVPYCPLATEAINDHWSQMRQEICQKAQKGTLPIVQNAVTLLLRDTNEGVVTNSNQYVTLNIDLENHDASLQSKPSSEQQQRLVFRFQAGNFFQINPSMIPILIQCILRHAILPKVKGERQITHVLDCYCGSGLFAIATAAYVQQCVGIEVQETAVEEATVNAKLNNVNNCVFTAATAETIFTATYQSPSLYGHHNKDTKNTSNVNISKKSTSVQSFPRDTTMVIIDPPRKGCSDDFVQKMLAYRPQRIAYLSCNVTTQARDIKPILAAGYSLNFVQPFDLFPQTRHIECLMVLENTDK